MKLVAIVFACSFCCLVAVFNAPAQMTKTVRVKAGSSINETLSASEIFHYPQFMSGSVYFKNGSTAASKLNYNLLSAEMVFIDKGDTLAIADEKNVQFVAIGTDTFFYDHGYMQLYRSYPTIKLARMEKIALADRQKMGAYGMASPASSIDTYNKVSFGSQFFKLTVQEDLILKWNEIFFIGDQANNFSPINKKNLLKMFPAYRSLVEGYLKDNAVNFNKEEDVVKLITFLQKS